MANFKVIVNGTVDNTADEILKIYQLYANQPGVFDKASNEMKVTQRAAGANLSVDVTCGTSLILNASHTANVGNGVNKHYLVQLDGVENVVVPAADVSNPRIDIVAVKVDTSAVATNPTRGASAGSITIVTGTPAATPSKPALPSNSYELAYYTLGAGATSVTNAMLIDSREQVRMRDTLYESPLLDNNQPVRSYDTGGTARSGVVLNSSNVWQFGDGINEAAVKTLTKFRAYRSTTQSIPTNSATTVVFDTENYDIGSDYATGTGVFTVPVNGYYMIAASSFWGNLTVDKAAQLSIYIDGVDKARFRVVSQASTDDLSVSGTDIKYLTAGSSVTIRVLHDEAAARNVASGEDSTWFAVHQLSI